MTAGPGTSPNCKQILATSPLTAALVVCPTRAGAGRSTQREGVKVSASGMCCGRYFSSAGGNCAFQPVGGFDRFERPSPASPRVNPLGKGRREAVPRDRGRVRGRGRRLRATEVHSWDIRASGRPSELLALVRRKRRAAARAVEQYDQGFAAAPQLGRPSPSWSKRGLAGRALVVVARTQ